MKQLFWCLHLILCLMSVTESMDVPENHNCSTKSLIFLNIPKDIEDHILTYMAEFDTQDIYSFAQTTTSLRAYFKTQPIHLNLHYRTTDSELRDADLKRYVIQFPRAISLDLNILFLSKSGLELLDYLPNLKSLRLVCQYDGPLLETKTKAKQYADGTLIPYPNSSLREILPIEDLQKESSAYFSGIEGRARAAKTEDEFIQEMESRRLAECYFFSILFKKLPENLVCNIAHYKLLEAVYLGESYRISEYQKNREKVLLSRTSKNTMSDLIMKEKEKLSRELMKRLESFCFFYKLEKLTLPVFENACFKREHLKLEFMDISKNCDSNVIFNPLCRGIFSTTPRLISLVIHFDSVYVYFDNPMFFFDRIKSLMNLTLFFNDRKPISGDILKCLERFKQKREGFKYEIVRDRDDVKADYYIHGRTS